MRLQCCTCALLFHHCLPLTALQVNVENAADGKQIVDIACNAAAGQLVLHWGVEGGSNYKGGWRLPGAAARPPGTVQYKDRALQSPFE